MIQIITNGTKRKTTVLNIQRLCGFLNFLGKAIVPGRAFSWRFYAITSMKNGQKLKQHHHVRLTQENLLDFRGMEILSGTSHSLLQTFYGFQ